MYTEQGAAGTCLLDSGLAHRHDCDTQGSPGGAGPPAGWLTSTKKSPKLPGVQTELPRVESSCRSPVLPGSLPKLWMTPSLSSAGLGRGGGRWAPPSPGTTASLAFCLHKSRPQGLGRGSLLTALSFPPSLSHFIPPPPCIFPPQHTKEKRSQRT